MALEGKAPNRRLIDPADLTDEVAKASNAGKTVIIHSAKRGRYVVEVGVSSLDAPVRPGTTTADPALRPAGPRVPVDLGDATYGGRDPISQVLSSLPSTRRSAYSVIAKRRRRAGSTGKLKMPGAKPVRPLDPIPSATAEIAAAIVSALHAKDPTGSLLASVDPAALANRVADQVDTAPLWSEHLGPVYSAKSVCGLLGISKQAVSQRRGLLRMTTGDGTVVYPAYQFDGNQPLPGFSPVVLATRGRVSDWTLASWFVSPNEDLAGRTPIDALHAGDGETVLDVARAWIAELAA